jgi:hypothetical protein
VRDRVSEHNQKEKPDMAQMKMTPAQDQVMNQIMELLRERGNILRPGGHEPLANHDDPQEKRVLKPREMPTRDVITIATRVAEAEEEMNVSSRTYRYRPLDGAVAVHNVLFKTFGAVLQKKSWFVQPQTINVEVAPGVHQQVEWGQLVLPPQFGADAILVVGETRTDEHGLVLNLAARTTKRTMGEIEVLFDLVQDELDAHSIYRGQAITASDQPQFLDVRGTSYDDVVFTQPTFNRLDFRLFSVIEKAHVYIDKGDTGKKIVWLHGDYGTGKSKLLKKLAAVAVAHGWTPIFVRPGVDTWDSALQMVRLYSPRVVVFVEDAESIAGATDAAAVSKMLDQLDGTEAKLLTQTLFVFTTNFIDKIQKAATRWGRADGIIRLGNMDRESTERLAVVELGDMLAKEIDWDTVYAAMGGAVLDEGGLPARDESGNIIFKVEADLTPAFMRQAFNTAKMVTAIRRGPRHKVTTGDLLDGVNDLQEQLLIHRAAPEPRQAPTLERSLAQALRPMVREAIATHLDSYRDVIYGVVSEAADNVVENRVNGAQINRESNGETWARVVTQ